MKKSLLPLTETAILIALATVLELIFKQLAFLEMPQGGKVSIATLPILIVGYRHGWKYGFVAGVSFAILNFMIDGFYWHWGSIFFDYIFAFGLLGVTGFFTKGKKNIFIFVLGIVVAGFLRYIMSSLSGVLFFGEYAADAGYADAVWFYSFIVYNLGYNLLSTIACAICGSLLWPFIIKENN